MNIMRRFNQILYLLLMGLLISTPLAYGESVVGVNNHDQEEQHVDPAAESKQVMRKKVIVRKANDAKQISLQTEQEQLQKARDASATTQERERKILKRQQSGDWEQAQREKAQAEFNNRQERESKYLNEAKAAAKQERKISKFK